MRFRLSRQIISAKIVDFGLKQIKKQKLFVPSASKKIVTQYAVVASVIQKRGLPPHLVRKKLENNLGYGIFLHPKAEPILRGDLVAPYSGIVTVSPQNETSESDYVFSLIADFTLTKKEQKLLDPKRKYHPRRVYSVDLDAHKTGNFTRYINHSEKPNVEAHFLSIPPNEFGLQPAPFELIYVAKKRILPGEQLLVCYEGEDDSYWGVSKIQPFPMTPKTFRLNPKLEVTTAKKK